MTRVWLLLFLLALGGMAHAAPQQVTAKYRVIKAGQTVGEISERFERNGQKQYRLESVTTATGIFAFFAKGAIRLQSEGSIAADGLRPEHFEHHRGADPARVIVADFDWKARRVSHKYDGKLETDTLPSGAQDRLSQLYQFMFEPPQPPAVEFSVSTGRKLNLYRYRVVGEETLDTPAGSFQTLHLSRPRTRDEDGVELWLAKSRHHVPVRIVFEDRDGGRLEQQLESLSILPAQ